MFSTFDGSGGKVEVGQRNGEAVDREVAGVRQRLTRRQSDVLAVIQAWRRIKGYPPTYRDVARSLYPPVNTNAVQGFVRILERKGYLEPVNGRARCLVEVA